MRKKSFSIALHPEIRQRLKAQAEKNGQVMGEVARAFIAEGLRRSEHPEERTKERTETATLQSKQRTMQRPKT